MGLGIKPSNFELGGLAMNENQCENWLSYYSEYKYLKHSKFGMIYQILKWMWNAIIHKYHIWLKNIEYFR